MTKHTYKGIPREKIPWYPSIDYNKCSSCGKCVDYCKLGVYIFDKKSNRPTIVNPFNCVVLCKGCQDICPSNAISHPPRKTTVELIRKIRKTQK
jgi:NAD-dependent dihydropyrimidine dehydrogenase PreA subunit